MKIQELTPLALHSHRVFSKVASIPKRTVRKATKLSAGVVTLLLCLSSAPAAHAALKTWSGGGTGNGWSLAPNWGGSGILNGDDLLFTGSTRLTNTEDTVGLNINSLAYTSSGFSSGPLTNGPGYTVTITNGVMDISGNNTNTIPWILGGSQSFTNQAGGTYLVFANTINMSNRSLTIGGGGNVFLNGVISGNGGTANTLTTYDGLTRLGAANTFSGDVTVNSGSLLLGNAGGIPSGAGRGNLNLAGGAALDLGNTSPTINGLNGGGVIDENPTTNAGNYTFTLGTANSNGVFSGVIANTRGTVSLVKAGTGTQVFNSAQQYFGATTVSGGTLALTNGGSVLSTNLSIGAGASLVMDGPSGIPNLPLVMNIAPAGLFDFSRADSSGGYQFQGNLSVGRSTGFSNDIVGNLTFQSGNLTIVPGAAGTLTLNGDLTLTGGTLNYDLSSVNTVGSGVNDLIASSGTINLSGGTTLVKIKPIAGSLAGTYTLMTSAHPIVGGPGNLQLAAPRGITAVFDTTSQPNNVLTTASGSPNPASLVWAGSGNGGSWDVQVSQDWTNNGVLDFFYDLDNVTFNDAAGTNNGLVSFPNAVSPSSTVVSNNAVTYTFGTANSDIGLISGTGSFTKDGPGTVTLNTGNNFTGNTSIKRGTVILGVPLTGSFVNTPALYNGVAPGNLILANGGIYLAVQANSAQTATFTNLTINPGGSSISMRNRQSNVSLYAVTVSNIVRSIGGTLDLNNVQGRSGNTVGIYLTNSSGVTTVNGILGGYAVFGENDWVNPIVTGNGSTAYAAYQVNTTPSNWGATSNINVTTAPSAITANQTINSLRLPAAVTVTINSGQSLTLSSGGLLVPANASGASSITGGTLMGAANADLIVHGNSLANNLTIGSVIADNGGATALTKAGQGTLVLTGNNTYSGATFINGPTIAGGANATPGAALAASTLQVGSGSTSGSISNSASVLNYGTLSFNRSDAMSYAGVISGPGAVKQSGSGTTILSADNTYFGATTIAGGTLQIGNGGATGSINNSPTVANAGTLVFNRSGNLSFGGQISGIGSLVVQSGTLTLTTNETYTGATTVTGGTLALGASGSISNSALVSVASGATLDASAAGGFTLNNQTVLAGGTIVGPLTALAGTGIKPGGSGTIGTLSLTGDLILNGGTVTMDVSGGSRDQINVQGNLNLTSPSVIAINNLGAPIANGVYKLVGYTGSLVGIMANLTVQFPFQPGQLASLSNAPNEIDLVVVTGFGATLTWVGDGAANIWNLAGTMTFTNDTGVVTNFHNNDNVNFTDAGSANSPVNISSSVSPASVTVNATSDYTFQGGGLIAGGSLFKTGPDTLVILTTNSYSGTTTISNGTLVLGNGSVNGSLGSGGIVNQAAMIFNENGNVTEAGAISGAGSITVNGSGLVTLSGNNSAFTGPLTINSAAVQVGSGASGSLGSGPVTNNTALIISRSDSGLTVNSPITGSGAVTNAGAGAVTVTGPNTYAGPTVIANGTLKAASSAAIPNGAGTANVIIPGGASAGVLDLNGQNLSINGLDGVSGAVLGQVINSSSSSNALTLGYGDAAGTFSGTIRDGSGKITLIKTGSGNQDLDIPTATANSFSGGMIISNGAIVVTSPGGGSPVNLNASQAALGSGPITLYTGGILSLAGSAQPIAQSTGPTWNNWSGTIVVPAGQTGTFHGPQRGQASPILQGSGTLLYQTAYVRGQYGGDATAFTGQILLAGDANGGNLGVNSISGFPNAHVFLTNGVNVYNQVTGTPTIPIGELAGDTATTVQLSGTESGNNNGALAANFAIGGLNTSTNFAGQILDNVGIIKVGTGTLSLDNSTLTYTGPTAVSNGVLIFSATVPATSSSFTIAAPGVLDVSTPGMLAVGDTAQTVQGNGTLRGSLSVNSSGNVYVGFSNAIGTLTITNSVSLNGATFMELNETNGVTGTNDQISAATIALGGTLNVTNIGPALHVGDTFKLFKTTGSLSGLFNVVNLATNDANNMGYTWTDNTAADGTITVLTATQLVNPNPTNITFSVSGGTLMLSWPADHIGWTLQMQTNGLTSTNWLDVPGSSSFSTTNIVINPAIPTTFYRLRL